MNSAFPQRFGDYTLLDELGSGGMGVVYRARQEKLGRIVALKILNAVRGTGDEEALARFRREGRIMAKLSHPNIVVVHDFGIHEDRLFISMELVSGRPLEALIRSGPLDPRNAMTLVAKVARALHHAHERGVIHRDVKPSNILIDGVGEPRLSDFGIARLPGSTVTAPDKILGTPTYMSPEQVSPIHGSIDARSDLYSLGAVLYELLTGSPPHVGGTVGETFFKILHEDPRPLRSVDPAIPIDAETVCLRLLAKDPDRRYPSGEALAKDIERFLAGESIWARRTSAMGRLWRKAVRHRTVLLPSLAAGLILAGLGAWTISGTVGRSREIEARLAAARRLETEGRQEEAADAYRRVLDLEKEHPAAKRGLDRVLAALDRKKEGIARTAALKGALALLETSRPAMEDLRLYLYGKEILPERLSELARRAQAPLLQAVQLAPRLAEGHHLLGQTWEALGEYDRAESCWREAIRRDPSFTPARYRLGRLLFFRGCVAQRSRIPLWKSKPFEESRNQLGKALSEARGWESPLQRQSALAMAALARGDRAGARRLAEEGTVRFPHRKGAEDLYFITGAYDRALAVRPRFSWVFLCRGLDRMARKEWKEAAADFTETIRIHPRDVVALTHRGLSLRAMGDRAAAADLRNALDLVPKDWPGRPEILAAMNR